MAYSLQTTTDLSNLGDAIRAKTGGSSNLTVAEMATAVANIPSSGGITSFEFTPNQNLSGGISANGGWLPIMAQLGSNFQFKKSLRQYFQNLFNQTDGPTSVNDCYDLSSITVPIQAMGAQGMNLNKLFYKASLTKLPVLVLTFSENPASVVTPSSSYYSTPANLASMFQDLNYVRNIPNNFFTKIFPTTFPVNVSAFQCHKMFQYCYSLRNIPDISFVANTTIASGAIIYVSLVANCYNLDEVEMPIVKTDNVTNNMFGDTFNACYNLSRIVFTDPLNIKTTAKNWSNQMIDLLNNVGYATGSNWFYNGGRTYQQKQITDYSTWELYHNDPDSYTNEKAFSKYNHDSAVETINSLPDVSSGSNNVIKFYGDAGSGYGKAISDLTSAEIQVATDKGWTVSIV